MNTIPSVTATQLKNETGSVLDRAARSPVKLTSHGRPRVYLVPAETFERLMALEEIDIAKRARRAIDNGMMGQDASRILLQGMLHAPNQPVARRGKIAPTASAKASKASRRKAPATAD